MRISDWSSDVCSSDLLALARALLKRPDLLVANEAISVLDGAGQNRLVERILDRRRGQGVIWTLQRPEMAALFDSILRSEEHTSELQSLMRISYAVFCLKKKKVEKQNHISTVLNTVTNAHHLFQHLLDNN